MKNKTFDNVGIIFDHTNSYDGRDFAETATRKIVRLLFS
jgi:hypothetical protein